MSADYCVSATVWVSGLTEQEAEDIEYLINQALAHHKPTVSAEILNPEIE